MNNQTEVRQLVLENYLEPLYPYFKQDIKELVINKPKELFLEYGNGTWQKIGDNKLSLNWVENMSRIFANLTGQKIDNKNPALSFQIPKTGEEKEKRGGHRVQLIFGRSITEYGFGLSIRVNRDVDFTIDDYVFDSQKEKHEIINIVKKRGNIIVSGGTGTGKTSFLNMLTKNYVEINDRMITIEGVKELKITQPNHFALFYSENKSSASGIDAAELLNNTLRLRPDRIIMGELRKENCFVFFRAINTGHDGSMATIHANSPTEAIEAMRDNVIMNGDAVEGAINIFEASVKKRIHAIAQLTRKNGSVAVQIEKFANI